MKNVQRHKLQAFLYDFYTTYEFVESKDFDELEHLKAAEKRVVELEGLLRRVVYSGILACYRHEELEADCYSALSASAEPAAPRTNPPRARAMSNLISVPRERLEYCLRRSEIFDDGADGADDESARSVADVLRALLAKPTKPAKSECPHCLGDSMFGCAECEPDELEQHQGEPVFYAQTAKVENPAGWCGLIKAELDAANGYTIPLYTRSAEQPAPVAVISVVTALQEVGEVVMVDEGSFSYYKGIMFAKAILDGTIKEGDKLYVIKESE